MHVKTLPYEILSAILTEVAQENIETGPTYVFGLSQAPQPLQKTPLQRYVRGLIQPQLLKWDATSTIRTVCWRWHEWALKYSLNDIYIQRWNGAEVSIV
jgi:hypothetical protein